MNDKILKCLTDKKNGENNKKLLSFCREPKRFGEMRKAGVKGDVFKVLVDLKKAEGIAFADGKYFTTQSGLEALQSIQ